MWNSRTEKCNNRNENSIQRFKQIRTLQKRVFVSWEIEKCLSCSTEKKRIFKKGFRDYYTEYRHTLKILQVLFQITGGGSCLQFVKKNETPVEHNKMKHNKTRSAYIFKDLRARERVLTCAITGASNCARCCK